MHENHNGFNLAGNDRIFLGEGLFETIKVTKSKPCFSAVHWQRLNNSAKTLGLSFDLSIEAWQQLLLEKIRQEKLLDGGIKVILTGGVAARGLIATGQHNQLLLQCFSYAPLLKPIRLTIASWLRDANNSLYQLKTINYLEAIIARRQAIQEGADDALFFNTQQYVTEATCANVFFLHQGRIITPLLTDGVLAGITRFRILNHCHHLNLDYAEVSINKEIISESEAVFLSNSLQGIHTVSAINHQAFAKENPIINHLIDLLAEEEKQYCLR